MRFAYKEAPVRTGRGRHHLTWLFFLKPRTLLSRALHPSIHPFIRPSIRAGHIRLFHIFSPPQRKEQFSEIQPHFGDAFGSALEPLGAPVVQQTRLHLERKSEIFFFLSGFRSGFFLFSFSFSFLFYPRTAAGTDRRHGFPLDSLRCLKR